MGGAAAKPEHTALEAARPSFHSSLPARAWQTLRHHVAPALGERAEGGPVSAAAARWQAAQHGCVAGRRIHGRQARQPVKEERRAVTTIGRTEASREA